MRRAIATVCIVVGLGALISAAPTPKPQLTIPQKLAQRVKFDGIDDPKATLGEALEKLTKLYGIEFEINEKAFAFENIQEVSKTEIASPDPIPAKKAVRLSAVLRKILARIPAPSGATYLVRSDRIEITTGTFRDIEIWGQYKGPHLPLVNATLVKTAFEDAIKELADQIEFNVILDNRAADKAKIPVSATLRNTPLDTALRLLTNMVDLRFVHLDNVLFITTKENADALESQLEKERNSSTPLDNGTLPFRRGSGPGTLIVAPGGLE